MNQILSQVKNAIIGSDLKLTAIKRGDIFIFDCGNVVGNEQAGRRPYLVIGNDIGNEKSPVLLTVPLTTSCKRWMPTHVPILADMPSTALCEQIHTFSKSRILHYVGHATDDEMKVVDKALAISIALDKTDNVQPQTIEITIEDAYEKAKEICDVLCNINNINSAIDKLNENANIIVANLDITEMLPPNDIENIRTDMLQKLQTKKKRAEKELKQLITNINKESR